MGTDKSIKIPVKKVKQSKGEKVALDSLVEAGFEVSHLKEKPGKSDMEVLNKGLIRVKFSKFLKLITNRDFEDLLDLYKDEDVVLDADFLVELASENSKSEEVESVENTNSSVLTGVLIGILISFILFLIYVN